MRRSLLILSLVSLPALNAHAFVLESLDEKTVEVLAEKGHLLTVEEDAIGTLRYVTAASVIHSTPDKIWDVLANLDDYEKFAPHTEEVRVLKREGDTLYVNFRMKIKFSIMSVGIDTTDEVTLDRSRWSFDWKYLRGDFPGSEGGWFLLPTADGRRTIAFYRIRADLRTLGIAVRLALRTHPELELGVTTAMATSFVSALKDRVEHPEKYFPSGAAQASE